MDNGEVISKVSIPSGVGAPGREEVALWTKAQIPYQNWAGWSDGFDEQVRAFVKGIESNFEQRMVGVYNRWKLNLWTANGNSIAAEYDDDLHVPETWKMKETIAPRIEEAIFDLEDPMMVEGVRDHIDQRKAVILTSYLRRMFELANYRDYVKPTIEDTLLTGIAALKLRWEHVFENIVERKIELDFDDDGNPV